MILNGQPLIVQQLSDVQRKLGIVAPPGALTFSLPLVNTAGNVSMPQSSAVQDGYLSAADFAIFAAGIGITQLTGDVTAGPGTGSQAATIAADSVTNAKLADAPANTIKGNNTAGALNPLDLTVAQTVTLLNAVVATRSIATTAPLTGGGDLSADRTFAIPAATDSVNGYLTSADHTKISQSLPLNIAGQRAGMYLS